MTTHDAHAGHDHADHGSHDYAGHSHGPGHSHAPASFAIGIALNVGFVAVEATYGVLSNSVALLADAGHNLSDVLGLVVAWIAMVLAKRAPSARYTYGMKGSSILAALFNAVFLLVAVGAIAWEAIQRFGEPVPVAGKTVMIVAAIGILVNGVTAWSRRRRLAFLLHAGWQTEGMFRQYAETHVPPPRGANHAASASAAKSQVPSRT